MDVKTIRVCHKDWFADVPGECEWVRDPSTTVSVVGATSSLPQSKSVESIEMTGRVLVRGGERVVISCGGLIVSVPTSLVNANVTQDATVVFTRSQ